MNEAPIQIRNPEVFRDIRALAELKGMALTDVMADAVRRELDEARATKQVKATERMRRVEATLARFDAIPNTGPLLRDDDLYDENGLPK
jgi:hypothetical protein